MKKELKYFDLENWYYETFTAQEKQLIENTYNYDDFVGFNGSSALWLSDLSSWFNTKENQIICEKIIKKSIELNNETNDENKYFMYGHYIQYFYKNREIGDNFNKAVFYCEKQIELYPARIAPASCVGYTQLAVIYKKDKQWNKVIELCNDAIKKNVGGDWQKRIDEATKKLNG